MNKRRATAIGMGLALSLSACSEGVPVVTPSPEQSLPAVAESAVSPGVVAAAAASVAIRASDKQGSGEVIAVNGHKMVLTAGHVGKLTAGAQCGGAEIDLAYDDRAEKVPVTGSAGVYEGEGFRDRDAALLGVAKGKFTDVPTAPLADRQPARGENAYIVSWQPEGAGSMMGSQRNPVMGPIRHPAIIGATFEGVISDNVAVFTPNGTSYDAMTGQRVASDTTFKPEGSGSAVVNSEGQVVAEAAKSTMSSLAAYPDQQAALYGMLGRAFDTTYGVVLSNLVSPATITDMATRPLTAPAECPLP